MHNTSSPTEQRFHNEEGAPALLKRLYALLQAGVERGQNGGGHVQAALGDALPAQHGAQQAGPPWLRRQPACCALAAVLQGKQLPSTSCGGAAHRRVGQHPSLAPHPHPNVTPLPTCTARGPSSTQYRCALLPHAHTCLRQPGSSVQMTEAQHNPNSPPKSQLGSGLPAATAAVTLAVGKQVPPGQMDDVPLEAVPILS